MDTTMIFIFFGFICVGFIVGLAFGREWERHIWRRGELARFNSELEQQAISVRHARLSELSDDEMQAWLDQIPTTNSRRSQ